MLNLSIKESAFWLRTICPLILTLLLASFGGIVSAGESRDDVETRLKVALVYKLPKFVQWPDETFVDSEQPLRLCVFGAPSVVGAFETLAGKHLIGRVISVEQPEAEAGALEACQLLFISNSTSLDRDGVNDILQQLEGGAALVISDIEGFASAGGGVEIYRQDARLALKINLMSTRRAGLQLAAPLLEISTIVEN